MQFLRNTGRRLLASGFSFFLFLIPLVFAVHLLVGSPAPLKRALRNSGTYNTAVSTAITQISTDQQDPLAKQVLADQGVKDVLGRSITPDLIQKNTEINIDAVYAWLVGKSDTIAVKIDTGDLKTKLDTNLTEYAKQRLSQLPTCTRAQLLAFDPNQSILSLTCLPPGTDINQAAAQFGDEAASRIDVANKTAPKIDTPKDPGVQHARTAFKLFVNYYWLILLFPLVLGGLYLLLHQDKLLGLRRLARIMLLNGVLIGILLGIASLIVNRTLTLLKDPGQGSVLQAKVVEALAPLVKDVQLATLWWVVGYVVLGAGILLTLHYRKKGSISTATPPQTTV